MSLREFWAVEAALLRDTSALLDTKAVLLDKSGFQITALQEPLQAVIENAACNQLIAKINFFDLKSLEAEKFIINYLTDPASERQAFLTNLKIKLVEKIDKEGSPSQYNETSTAKETLKTGWADWKTTFDTTGNEVAAKVVLNSWYNYLRGNTAEEVANNGEKLKKLLKEAMTNYQNEDKKTLSQLNNKDFKNSMNLFFVNSIWNKTAAIVHKISNFIDEQVLCINRYDSIYKSADLEKALLLNPYTRFYPSEIKAINMQETADFTDLGIAGMTATGNIGIPKKSLGQGQYIGIAQLNTQTSIKGAKEMIELLTKEGKIEPITQKKWKDFKPTINAEAIVLFSIYLIETERLIIAKVGADTWKSIDCIEKKKFVICGFNTGFADISSVLTEFRQQKKTLRFSEELVERVAQKASSHIADATKKKTKYNEVKSYTFSIIERLRGY